MSFIDLEESKEEKLQKSVSDITNKHKSLKMLVKSNLLNENG